MQERPESRREGRIPSMNPVIKTTRLDYQPIKTNDMNLFHYHLPEPGVSYQYSKKLATKLNERDMRGHERHYDDIAYGGVGTLKCNSAAYYERIVGNVLLGVHDAWAWFMEHLHVIPRYYGPAIFKLVFSEDPTLPDGEIILTWVFNVTPTDTEAERRTPGWTTGVKQDESIAKYGFVPEEVPYCRKCTKESMELWVKPFREKSKPGKKDVVSLKLSILGSADEGVMWEDTLDTEMPVFASQRKFVIGGANAHPGRDLVRLNTDTVADRHLEGRRRLGGWEIRPMDGTVYIDGVLVDPDAGWIRVDDVLVVTLNDTTVSMECHG